MRAIYAKFIPTTETKPARVKAFSGKHSVAVSFHGDHPNDDPYRAAAEALCAKMDWQGKLIGGGLENGDRVYVFADSNL